VITTHIAIPTLFSQSESISILCRTFLKDKYNETIDFFDLLVLDGKVLHNTTKNKEYFLCTWDYNYGRVDFLYFDYEIQDFIWFDNIHSNHLIKIANAFEILLDHNKKLSIPKQVLSKIKTMIDGSNEYYQEYASLNTSS